MSLAYIFANGVKAVREGISFGLCPGVVITTAPGVVITTAKVKRRINLLLGRLKSGWIGLWVVAAMIAVLPVPARATLFLQLSSGGQTVTIEDGGIGDMNTAVGAVTFMGSVGGFAMNISTGTSKPILGDSTYGALSLGSTDFSGSAAGDITIRLTDTNYTQQNISSGAFSAAGVTDGTVTTKAYIDFDNQAFGQSQEISDLGQFVDAPTAGSSSFSATEVAELIGSNAAEYSLTIVTTISHARANLMSSVNAALEVYGTVPVSEPDAPVSVPLAGGGSSNDLIVTANDDPIPLPAPGSLALFGFGILCLRWRRKFAERRARA